MSKWGNRRYPFVTRRALGRLGLLKCEEVTYVDTSLIANIELQQELFDVYRQERLVDHEVELF